MPAGEAVKVPFWVAPLLDTQSTLPEEAMLALSEEALTVTKNEQVAVLPLPSTAVATTVVVPMGNALPEAGLKVMAGDAVQLSVVVAA
jgi:hypothetical protein